MRIGKVTGRVTLSRCYDTLCGGRFLIVSVLDRFALSGQPRKTTESLVVYDHMNPIWDSKTYGAGFGCFAVMQGDGNLVVYDEHHQMKFNTETVFAKPCTPDLEMQNDNNLVLYARSCLDRNATPDRAIWSSRDGHVEFRMHFCFPGFC